MIIAGIGARTTPESILNEMVLVGKYCCENKIWVRSGHAEGADWAFERGAQEYCLVYLPWNTFNHELKSRAHRLTVEATPELLNIVKTHHPSYYSLSSGVKSLMARNVYQVLGIDISDPSNYTNAVVCWTPNGELVGGTSFAIRLANSVRIPILNMANSSLSTAEKVIKALRIIEETNVNKLAQLS